MINITKLSVYRSIYKLKKRLLRFYHLVIITNFKGTKFVFKHLHSYLQVCSLKKIQKVNNSFHPRYDAKSRVYKYFLQSSNTSEPYNRNYSYLVKTKIELNELKSVERLFIGKKNSKRYPLYFRWDVSFVKRKPFFKGNREFYFQIINITKK